MVRLKTGRGRFVITSGASLACGALLGVPARPAQFEFKCGSDFPLDHPSNHRQTQMWAEIAQESGGRIHTQFYPNSELGSAAAQFTQLRVGALHFQILGPGFLAAVVPAADVGYLGFAYTSAEEGLRVMDGPLGAYIRDQAATKGLHVLHAPWDSGMYETSSSTHPIRVPDDLHGFKVRVAESRIFVDLFKNLGAIPTPLATSEVYTALQTKIADGQTAPLVNMEAAKWYEVQKYMSLTNHAWNGPWVVANGDVWKSLPSDLQDIIERNNTKYSLLERNDTRKINGEAAGRLEKRGILFNQVDPAPFRALLRPYYQFWANTFGTTAWSLLERSIGKKLV